MADDIQDILKGEADEAGGVLPFHRFMELALYHPRFGYYQAPRERLGAAGDFVTAPEITSLFGELLTLQIHQVWEAMGSPARLDVVEAGPGSGRLAADILTTAKKFPQFGEAVDYTLVEISPSFRSLQEKTLDAAGVDPAAYCWVESVEEAAGCSGISGVILSNELIDAFPVHWLEMTGEGLRELGTVFEEGRWRPVPLGSSGEVPDDYFSGRGIELPVGSRVEAGLAGQAWMRQAGKSLDRGLILTIDYGYPMRELYSDAYLAGTLVGHYRHERVDDPLLHPGEMDLTAHVDFSALAEAGEAAGLTTLGFTTQAWFLMGLGVLQRLERLTASGGGGEKSEALKQAVMRLILPDAMGERFKVLLQGRGLDGFAPFGCSMNDRRKKL